MKLRSKKISRFFILFLCCGVVCLCGYLLTASFTSKQSKAWQYSERDVTFDKELWESPVVLDRVSALETQKRVHGSIVKVCNNQTNLFYQNLNKLNTYYLHYLLVDEKNKFMYCYVPKVSCTVWKQIMIELDGVSLHNFTHDDIHDYSFKRLKDYNETQRERMLHLYKKFMFIREPFERVVSAFRDKFEKNNTYFRTRIATDIIKEHRKNPTAEALKKGDDLQFTEYIKSIAERKPDLDEHWTPASTLCQPCIINYDIIGYQESLERDANVVLRFIGVADKVKFPEIKTAKTGDKLQKYFENIPAFQVGEVIKVFEADFKMFGYSIPVVLRRKFSQDEVR